MSRTRDDWWDELVRRGLDETARGAQPPDLREAIRARLGSEGLEASGVRAGTQRSGIGMCVAAGLVIAAGLTWLRWSRSSSEPPHAVPLPVQVVTGELLRTRVDLQTAPEPWHTPQVRSLALHDSLTTGPLGATLRVEAMGTLTLRPQTRIEIQQMTLTRTQDRLVVASVAALVTAGAVGWATGMFEQTAEIGETVRLERNDLLPDGMTRMDVAALQREVEQLRAQVQAQVDRAQSPTPEPTAMAATNESAEEHPTETTVAALFEDPAFADVLGEIDWASAGGTIQEMMPIMEKLRAAMAEGGDPPLELIGELSKLNADLISLAGKVVDAGVPGAGINGSFTHPSVVANTLGHTLEAAGLGLSEDQVARMEGMLKYYRAEDEGLRSPGTEPEFALEAVIREGAMKDRMFEEMSSMLSTEQLTALRPGEIGGRTSLDMFSTGVIWNQFARPIGGRDAGDYASRVAQHLGGELRLDDTQAAQLREIVQRSANALPPETWSAPDPLARNNMMELTAVRAAAERHMAMLREIAQTMNLSEEQLRSLQRSQVVPVPIVR